MKVLTEEKLKRGIKLRNRLKMSLTACAFFLLEDGRKHLTEAQVKADNKARLDEEHRQWHERLVRDNQRRENQRLFWSNRWYKYRY